MKNKKIASKIAALIMSFSCIPFMKMALKNNNVNALSATSDEDIIVESGDYNPSITFFVHGLGGRASDWSNSFSEDEYVNFFKKDNDSIIEKMRAAYNGDVNLYRINTTSYYVYNYEGAVNHNKDKENRLGTVDSGIYKEYEIENHYSVNAFDEIDFGDHTIIAYEYDSRLDMESDDNDSLYGNFKKTIDGVLKAYLKKNPGSPARINLVGHSLGGLLNMRYAINHKKTVANLISLGTPYNDSWYNNPLCTTLIPDAADFEKQKCLTGKCGHEWCNLETRKIMWNDYYSQNPDINFYALSGETGRSLINKLVITNDFGQYVKGGGGIAAEIFGVLTFTGFGSEGLTLPGDVCVDKESQMAQGYKGVINYNKKFGIFDSTTNKRAENYPAVPHNLETYDPEMHEVILQALVKGNQREHYSKTINGIAAEIFCKIDDTWLIKITNTTSQERSFEYNAKMCNSWDSDDWDNLEDIENTQMLKPGQSTIVGITENVWATDITISYQLNDSKRLIMACTDLDPDDLNMFASEYEIECPVYSLQSNSIQICELSYNGDLYTFRVTNNTGAERYFYFTTEMPSSFSNIMQWTCTENIERTPAIKDGESAIIQSKLTGSSNSKNVGIFYIENGQRHIFCAHRSSYRHFDDFDANVINYNRIKSSNDVEIGCIGRNDEYIILEVKNPTTIDKTYEFNASHMNKDDGLNWIRLTNYSTIKIKSGESHVLFIKCDKDIANPNFVVSYETNFYRYVTVFTLNSNVTNATFAVKSLNDQMKVTIEKYDKDNSEWVLTFENNTGSARTFFYNKKMCNYSDATDWTGLVDIGYFTLENRSHKEEIRIKTNNATSIAFSYISGRTRYVLTGFNLNKNSLTLDTVRTTSEVYPCDAGNGLTVRLLGKDNKTWLIELENSYAYSSKSIEYSTLMCTEENALNWTGLGTINKITLGSGGKTKEPIKIQENGTKGYIAISYLMDNYRYIFYAHYLLPSCYMDGKTTALCDVEGMTVINNGLNGNTWNIKLVNNTGKSRFFYYNTKTCFIGHASKWDGLDDIARTPVLSPRASTNLYITKNGPAETIAISFVEITSTGATSKGIRFICYADNLKENGAIGIHKSTVPYNSYNYYNVEFSILSQHGTTWLIEATNNTSESIRFDYNSKMCFWDDAYYWEDLYDMVSSPIVGPGKSTILRISTNVNADTLCISWISGDYRRIFYPMYPDISRFELTKLNTTKSIKKYNCDYGFSVSIVGKNGSTWLLDLTNNRDVTTTFIYNSKTCFEGDAEKWSGLSDEKSITLKPKEKTSLPIQITKNGFAETIAISFMNGTYRYIFYAYDLDEDGTIKVRKQNSFDTAASSSSNCVAKGTLITLANGQQKKVEDLTGDEMLLVWNFETGTYDYAPILFIDKDPKAQYEVIRLYFSDGTTVDVVSEHGFFDTTLNEYVYLDKNAEQYIGHKFIKRNKKGRQVEVTLKKVKIMEKTTTTYSPVTCGYLCYYVNGMLSMPGGIDGMFNYFEIDEDRMMYDQEQMAADIEKYGLYTYEEIREISPLITEEMFEVLNGKYLKIAVGKGLITEDEIRMLAERYASFFENN